MLRYMALTVVINILTTGCQTSMLAKFSEVKPGMEKAEVLDLIGSPRTTQRFHGKDRWTYVFYDNRIRFEKEVHFFNGDTVYVGDIWIPEEAKSAVAADSSNDSKNREIDERLSKEITNNRNAYQEYEAKVKTEDKVHYSPNFEPVR